MKKFKLSMLASALLVTTFTTSIIQATDILSPANVRAGGLYPYIMFDAESSGTDRDWVIETYAKDGNTGHFKIYDDIDDINHNYKEVFGILHSLNNENSLIVNSDGDINLADGSVWIDRSANFMGIGTVDPDVELDIKAGYKGIIRLGTSDAKIRLDAGASSSWDLVSYNWFDAMCTPPFCLLPIKQFRITDNNTSEIPFSIDSGAETDSLHINANSNVGIGTSGPTAKLDVRGDIAAAWTGSDTANNHNILALSVNNSGTGASDTGFSLENKETDFKWTFRTYAPTEGFAASKIGTGGTEFQVDNTGATVASTKVYMGGALVFENGHLVTTSSRSLKTDIKPLDREAALDAFHKLQPVSYAYKAHKEEPVVGFIAEDVPELVAMPSHKSIDSTEIVAVLTSVVKEQEKQLKAQAEKIAKLELMQKRLVRVESLLTNLALDTENTTKEKVSLNK